MSLLKIFDIFSPRPTFFVESGLSPIRTGKEKKIAKLENVEHYASVGKISHALAFLDGTQKCLHRIERTEDQVVFVAKEMTVVTTPWDSQLFDSRFDFR